MEDRFDVVPVGVNDERCVIPGVVMRAETRRAVVAATGFDSGAVELVDGGSVGCGEGHMNGSGRRFPFPDPEISTALDREPRPLRALHYLHSERLEGPLVEGAAASQVTYSQGQVVDEGKRHGQRHALYFRARPLGNTPEHRGRGGGRYLDEGVATRRSLGNCFVAVPPAGCLDGVVSPAKGRAPSRPSSRLLITGDWIDEDVGVVKGPFVPSGIVVPLALATESFRLEPLGPQHNDSDYEAWSSSVEHIHMTPGWETSSWPDDRSLVDNLRDLQRHADDFENRAGFTYTVLDPATGEVIGCVYIYPDDSEQHDARVRSWVRASRPELDAQLWRAVTDWLSDEWPFERVAYAERA